MICRLSDSVNGGDMPTYLAFAVISMGSLAFLIGYVLGRNDGDWDYTITTMTCGRDVKTVEYAKNIDNQWILFKIKNDQPRVVSRKRCFVRS